MRDTTLTGCPSFRDFGGWAGAGGQRVRSGALYRSGRLSQLTDDDRRTLDELGLRAVFDLRSRREIAADPTDWAGPVQTHTFKPGHKRRLADMAEDYPPTREGATRLMMEFYDDLPFAMAATFGAIIAEVADGAVPCLIHCSAGKDRTGMAAALILGALGVSRADIVADYTRTTMHAPRESDMAASVTKDPRRDRFGDAYSPEAIETMRAADPRYIEAALGAIDREHGSMAGYLEAIGVDEARQRRLRDRLLAGEARIGERA